MLDLDRLERIRFTAKPVLHDVIATAFLGPNYTLPPRVTIDFEGEERIPDEPVIYLMNHTDRFNYMPFQYRLWRTRSRYTATWVKGKYFEHPAMAWFMEKTNQLPTVSRGYIIARDVKNTLGRAPTAEEYAALRALVNGARQDDPDPAPAHLPDALLTAPRSILGRDFDPARESYGEAIQGTFLRMMRQFTRLNERAHEVGLDIIIFPQGTRSICLSQGRIGAAEIALHLRATIVPVGCNGSDTLYPGNSPWARPGRVVYRFGEPMRWDELSEFAPPTPFEPFAPDDEARYRENFQALTDVVMDRINGLLDPPYQYSDDRASDGTEGMARFL